ncbi:hypothetical protein KJ564_08865 [bacterium]|nr:hypothetical protein [bacterium]MBU1881769.1 hypothetical protein [bacterium]
MHDRLSSLKFFRAMRNIFFCLSGVFLLEASFLLLNFFLGRQDFLNLGLLFMALSGAAGYMAYYYHGRFRCRE